ncbi:disulfide bond formation protein B [Centipeda periodontii DSM 2778]|uniref:Disulfide bond formation protein B n=1 Tax=Centipeda periodontii DSM 2778 TaxID=888060 RepID=F5RJH4_9FIRM|nr:disulfide bond formation protein B [Centipeda periodontii DSM 2778]
MQHSGARDSVGLLALLPRLLRLPGCPVTYWSILSITAAGPHRLMKSQPCAALPDFPVTPRGAPNLLMKFEQI